ncbi:MAG: response regulator transcription factor [Anaerolineales bacterium]|nr:MAG: response regulator transcription factor [Anaerolineales bacterium]
MQGPQQCILVADDELDLTSAVSYSLSHEGYKVLVASDGLEALSLARREHPDLIILDILMPGLNGLEICRRLRRDPGMAALPVLFLTVRSDIEDQLAGWEEGCDDYLVKPFDMRELQARVRALLRRSVAASLAASRQEGGRAVLVVGSLTLDENTHQATVGDKSVELTPTEYRLLRHLMRHPNQVCSSHRLLREVWGYDQETATLGLVRWHIKNLRGKIERDPSHPLYIRTSPRHGYILTGGT